MNPERIKTIEEIIEKYLLDAKDLDVMIKYLIYQQLKKINKKLDSIEEALIDMANSGIWELKK